MFRSTDDQGAAPPPASQLQTPYFMLVQMNNAPLLEAYATLGIQPVSAKIEEKQFPKGFSLAAAAQAQPIGVQNRAQHPGQIYADGADPIAEMEGATHGKAAEMSSLSLTIAGRFADMVGGGGDFSAMIDTMLAMAALPGLDFAGDAAATGAAMLQATEAQSSCRADPAGQAPFTGFRADYRPETAPTDHVAPGTPDHPSALLQQGFNMLGAIGAIGAEIMATRHHRSRGRPPGGGN